MRKQVPYIFHMLYANQIDIKKTEYSFSNNNCYIFLYSVLFTFSGFVGEVLYFAAFMSYLLVHLAPQCNEVRWNFKQGSGTKFGKPPYTFFCLDKQFQNSYFSIQYHQISQTVKYLQEYIFHSMQFTSFWIKL